jgi:hypothetical protein
LAAETFSRYRLVAALGFLFALGGLGYSMPSAETPNLTGTIDEPACDPFVAALAGRRYRPEPVAAGWVNLNLNDALRQAAIVSSNRQSAG